MSRTYFSQNAAARHDIQLRRGFEDRLRHHAINRIGAELAQRTDTEPPTFREVAAQIGWGPTVDGINQWNENGCPGTWQAYALGETKEA